MLSALKKHATTLNKDDDIIQGTPNLIKHGTDF
jgi:hypothetical protein